MVIGSGFPVARVAPLRGSGAPPPRRGSRTAPPQGGRAKNKTKTGTTTDTEARCPYTVDAQWTYSGRTVDVTVDVKKWGILTVDVKTMLRGFT